MTKNALRRSVNVLAVIATLVVNGLANALPLNGQTTGEISDRFEVYFVPAGYVFSILGMIYLGIITFVLVILWAFVGIAVKHRGVPVVTTGAWSVMALVALALVGTLVFDVSLDSVRQPAHSAARKDRTK